jgi:hypothetical protein
MILSQLQPNRLTHTARATPMMPRMQLWKKAGLIGMACIAVSQPNVALAATISGSADAPDQSVANEGEDKQPPNFKYTHMWVSKDGETHISECEMKGFLLKSFAQKGAPQYVKQSSIEPNKTSFTQLPPGTVSPMHSCPGVQYVFDMSGSWYVETTDGTRREFQPGEVLFQDDVENSPAAKPPQHASGTVGSEPCNQMVLQVNRAPELDNPCPF